MKQIPTQKTNPNGLHQRYRVQKIDKSGAIHATDPGSEYFVMRLDEGGKDREHIKACRIGVHAYADAIEHHLPELAKDLREGYPNFTQSPSTPQPGLVEQLKKNLEYIRNICLKDFVSTQQLQDEFKVIYKTVEYALSCISERRGGKGEEWK